MVRQREATLQRLYLKTGERVIDVGCGPGFLCESMAAAVGPAGRVVGIDISKDLIDFASAHNSRDSLEYRVGSATALPAETAQFDIAVSTQVIEYVADADAALGELARVLRPGGRVFIVDTDFDSWVWHASDAERMVQIMKGWEAHCAHSQLPRTLVPRLRAAGFAQLAVEGYPILEYDLSARRLQLRPQHVDRRFPAQPRLGGEGRRRVAGRPAGHGAAPGLVLQSQPNISCSAQRVGLAVLRGSLRISPPCASWLQSRRMILPTSTSPESRASTPSARSASRKAGSWSMRSLTVSLNERPAACLIPSCDS